MLQEGSHFNATRFVMHFRTSRTEFWRHAGWKAASPGAAAWSMSSAKSDGIWKLEQPVKTRPKQHFFVLKIVGMHEVLSESIQQIFS